MGLSPKPLIYLDVFLNGLLKAYGKKVGILQGN
jgi:hypothetical protein